MSTIDFVVLGSEGDLDRGSIGGSGAQQITAVTPGSEISLNLNQGQILSYGRSGTALEITLVDGQVIVIENFFGLDGQPANSLLISTNGGLTDVTLIPGEGSVYYATYSAAGASEKWAPESSLFFADEPSILLAGPAEPETGMLATGFLAGFPVVPALLATGATAAAAGTVLDSGEDRLVDPSDVPGRHRWRRRRYWRRWR